MDQMRIRLTYMTDMTCLTKKTFTTLKTFKICLVQKMQWPPKPAAKKY
jgi:hypothetical protein